MDQQRPSPTQYLQGRVTAHQAETSRTQRNRGKTPRQSNIGRDVVYLERNGNGRDESPIAPSSWRQSGQDTNSSRRSSVVGPNESTTPRSMGAREQDDTMRKLQNENFNLKMDLTYAKKKVEELGQKLQDIPDLEAENDKLATLYVDAEEELKFRSKVIQQAVAEISDLEQRNRELEQCLKDMQSSRTSSSRPRGARTSSSGRAPASQTTPESRKQRSLRNQVSPDVSARMAELSSPPKNNASRQPLPSFLSSNEPSTAALRNFYVEDDKLIRPIPSRATMLDDEEDGSADGDLHAALRSPQLSEMSEEHFGRSRQASPANQLPLAEMALPLEHETEQNRLADTTRWVADSALSTPTDQKAAKSTRKPANEFQSLEQVLQREPAEESFIQPRHRLQQQMVSRDAKGRRTPPATADPSFGPNLFPPTPDTMLTRPSYPSSSSVTLDRTGPETTPENSNRLRPQNSGYGPGMLPSGNVTKKTTPSSSRDFMPQVFDAYDDPDRNPDMDPFGRPLYLSSDSSESPETPRRHYFQNTSLAGSTVIDADSARGVALSRSSQSPERTFESRRQPPSIDSRFNEARDHSRIDTRILPQHDGAGEVRTMSSRSTQSSSRSTRSLVQTPQSTHSQGIDSGIPIIPQTESARPAPGNMSPLHGRSAARRIDRAAGLRERFNRFTRRLSITSDGGTTPTGLPTRRNSITQRIFRRSSSASRPVALMQPGEGMRVEQTVGPAAYMVPASTADPFSAHRDVQRPSSSLQRAKSAHPPVRPVASASASSQSIPERSRGLLTNTTPVMGEFGELKHPRRASATKTCTTRTEGKDEVVKPLVQTATISFPTRGRENSVGAKARGVLRSLSRTRVEPARPPMTGRRG